MDAGETISQAAVRECLEEVGLHLDARSLEVAHVMHRAGDAWPDGTRDSEDERIDFFLVVRAWHGEPANAEPEKCDDLRWCEIEHLPENTVPYLRHVLRCVREGIRYSEFGW